MRHLFSKGKQAAHFHAGRAGDSRAAGILILIIPPAFSQIKKGGCGWTGTATEVVDKPFWLTYTNFI